MIIIISILGNRWINQFNQEDLKLVIQDLA